MLALLEAIADGDPAAILKRAVEKDLRELIARSRQLRADLALSPDVGDPIIAEAIESVWAEVEPGGCASPRAVR